MRDEVRESRLCKVTSVNDILSKDIAVLVSWLFTCQHLAKYSGNAPTLASKNITHLHHGISSRIPAPNAMTNHAIS